MLHILLKMRDIGEYSNYSLADERGCSMAQWIRCYRFSLATATVFLSLAFPLYGQAIEPSLRGEQQILTIT